MLVIPATRESGTLVPGAPEPAGTE
jgi:hypothetical protein